LKVLVIGSGGREHAITWRLAQSPLVKKLYAAPGNPGMAAIAECLRPVNATPEGFLEIAESADADLTVAGPEAPLVAGVVDLFRSRGRRIIGPSATAARLEGSKIFAKGAMRRFGVPTARFETVESETEARNALARFQYPVVLKADGLAAGKGVVVVHDQREADITIRQMLSGELVGQAGLRIVIEEFLQGEEVSFIVLSDGKDVVPLEPTQDHKAVRDGDTGPNTGGMGAYCDTRILTPAESQQVLDLIVRPVIENMREQGSPFTGFLYAGLMMTSEGPKVLEFNVRLGDPEAQPLMYRMNSDFAALLSAAANEDLQRASITWKASPSVCVVLASAGYPGKPRTGDVINGIEDAEALGATVFHAGTKIGQKGLETSGGRVLGVTASDSDLAKAIERTYAAAAKIHFDGMHYRKDIGRKGLKRWSR
jgi:phosphoribosylamine--glycine ligase